MALNIETTRHSVCQFPVQLCVEACSVCNQAEQQLWFEWAGDIRGERLAGQAAAIKFIRARFAQAPREYLFAIYLDSKLRICDISSLGRGSIDSVQVSIAEIIQQGFAVGAACFLLIHNHPSGDPTPSQTDLRITKRIHSVSHELDMPLVDHLVVATGGIRSVGIW